MGIKGLFALIKKHAPGAITVSSWEDIAGNTIAVDISIKVYQWYASGVSHGTARPDGHTNFHIWGVKGLVASMRKHNIIPLFVFDGEAPTAKANTVAARNILRDAGAARPPKLIFDEVREVLRLLGVACITAPAEAESHCARLNQMGLVYGVLTEDSDVIPFGATRWIRQSKSCGDAGRELTARKKDDKKEDKGKTNAICEDKGKPNAICEDKGKTNAICEDKDELIIVNGPAVLQSLRFSRAMFIDLCILLGCDYSGTLPGIGPVGALSCIRDHINIERVILATAIVVPSAFLYQIARNEFNNPLIGDMIIPDAPTPLPDELTEYISARTGGTINDGPPISSPGETVSLDLDALLAL